MATILDVAKMAGVSQGTASNVLNGKGNVSSEKIRAVEEAARKLGYTINERAKILRKGSGNLICVILPTIEIRQYREFYNSLKYYAERNGYTTELLVSNDNPQVEMEMIQRARSVMATGVAAITCLKQEENAYIHAGFKKVCFVERRPKFEADYFGFRYELAGIQVAEHIGKKGYRSAAVVTDSTKYSNEEEFLRGFLAKMEESRRCKTVHISTDIRRISHTILNTFAVGEKFDAIVTTSMGFAEKIRQIKDTFVAGENIDIYTLSPVVSLPEKDYKKYELNYSLLGKEVAARIIETPKECFVPEEHLFENDGERNWKKVELKVAPAKCLNVLTLESPEASIMQGLARLYTEETGTEIRIAIYSYDEIYEQFVNSESSDLYDIFRIDVTWLSWFAQRLLVPLEVVDPNIKEVFGEYIPSLIDKYSCVRGKLYALPVSPSVQLLFYRKDLFENNGIRRLYREKYKRELKVPETFEEFNQIAGFFSEGERYDAGIRYGTSLTVGNTGVAATEFLTRLFSHKENLYDADGRIVVNDGAGRTALKELILAQQYSSVQPSKWWTSSAKDFANGNSALLITFSNFASEILGTDSKIVGNIGFGMVPGGNPIYGGGSLGISKNSRNKEDAVAFIKWLTKEPVASAMAALGGVSPCLKTYSKYDIINAFPWLELSKDCFAVSRTKRIPDFNDNPFDEKRLLHILGTAVKNAIMGFFGVEETLERAQKLIDTELNQIR